MSANPRTLDPKMKDSGLQALKRGAMDIRGGLNLVALASAHFQSGGYDSLAQSTREHMCEMYDTMKEFEEFLKKLEGTNAPESIPTTG